MPWRPRGSRALLLRVAYGCSASWASRRPDPKEVGGFITRPTFEVGGLPRATLAAYAASVARGDLYGLCGYFGSFGSQGRARSDRPWLTTLRDPWTHVCLVGTHGPMSTQFLICSRAAIWAQALAAPHECGNRFSLSPRSRARHGIREGLKSTPS